MYYDFKNIENKWRNRWLQNPINKPDPQKVKYYCLDMFPYPSGSGLHVGHWRGYVLSDVISRVKLLQGYEVLHPMGWDAFGLPAENFAIKNGVHPATSTMSNITNAKRQLKEMSAIFDWSREVNTTDPKFYKWTQWIFLKMFEKGLAYEKEMPLNWCPDCKTVLANEEAKDGHCERCGSEVTKKNLRQWMLRITAYAERLLADLDKLDWPEKVKKMQADWIGKSVGAEIEFPVYGTDFYINVYTTRPDTLYGATFLVMAPEHYLTEVITCENQEHMEEYIRFALNKGSVDRVSSKEKTGVFTGSYAVNPINHNKIPIWVSDYVLSDYGTGAVMCVPAHDKRDYEFAVKYGLQVIQVISKENRPTETLSEPLTEEGILINSGQFNGLTTKMAREKICDYLQKFNVCRLTAKYKLRDWVFSRQRYWGEPIPLIHCPKCGTVAVPESDLPVLLPNVECYMPTATGESPLSLIDEWVNTTCPKCGGSAKRETNTMPQWAGSSWYFLRYADPDNHNCLAGEDELNKWLPVDNYVGGVEHAVLHLLYSRFYTKFLYDIGVLKFDEPFIKLFNQGMITKDGEKMSKSKDNVVSPDDLIKRYGCDSLRMYELFVGPPDLDAEWNDKGIEGVFRYLCKLWRLVTENAFLSDITEEMDFLRNKMIFDISTKIDDYKMNTAISSFMEYTRKIMLLKNNQSSIDRLTIETLLILLSPFAPHIAEELWEFTGHTDSVFSQEWPKHDPRKISSGIADVSLQVNGRFVKTINVLENTDEGIVTMMARDALVEKLSGRQVRKIIYKENRIINFLTMV